MTLFDDDDDLMGNPALRMSLYDVQKNPKRAIERVERGVEIKMFRIRSTWSILNGCGERDHSQNSGDLGSRDEHSVSRNEPKRPRF